VGTPYNAAKIPQVIRSNSNLLQARDVTPCMWLKIFQSSSPRRFLIHWYRRQWCGLQEWLEITLWPPWSAILADCWMNRTDQAKSWVASHTLLAPTWCITGLSSEHLLIIVYEHNRLGKPWTYSVFPISSITLMVQVKIRTHYPSNNWWDEHLMIGELVMLIPEMLLASDEWALIVTPWENLGWSEFPIWYVLTKF